MITLTRTCNVCQHEKDLDEFGVFTQTKINVRGEKYTYTYLRLNCKSCHAASTKLSVLKRQMRIRTMLQAFNLQPTTTTI